MPAAAYTSVAAVRSWIDDTVKQFKQNFTEYTFELPLKVLNGFTGVEKPFTAVLNLDAQDAANVWASDLLGKVSWPNRRLLVHNWAHGPVRPPTSCG